MKICKYRNCNKEIPEPIGKKKYCSKRHLWCEMSYLKLERKKLKEKLKKENNL